MRREFAGRKRTGSDKKPIDGKNGGQDVKIAAVKSREELIECAAKSESKEARMAAIERLKGDTEALIEVIEKTEYVDSAREASMSIPEDERRYGKHQARYEEAVSDFHKRLLAIELNLEPQKGL